MNSPPSKGLSLSVLVTWQTGFSQQISVAGFKFAPQVGLACPFAGPTVPGLHPLAADGVDLVP